MSTSTRSSPKPSRVTGYLSLFGTLLPILNSNYWLPLTVPRYGAASSAPQLDLSLKCFPATKVSRKSIAASATAFSLRRWVARKQLQALGQSRSRSHVLERYPRTRNRHGDAGNRRLASQL